MYLFPFFLVFHLCNKNGEEDLSEEKRGIEEAGMRGNVRKE